MSERISVQVLQECIDLQLKKSKDYQNPNSNVTQAMYYRNGINTIHDVIHGKVLRAQSLIESGSNPNFESLEDSYKDIINYCSFAVSWLRGGIPGQDQLVDMFNNKKPGLPATAYITTSVAGTPLPDMYSDSTLLQEKL